MAIVGPVVGAFSFAHNRTLQVMAQQLPYMQTVQYVEFALGAVLNLFFAYMIFRRHNWARIVVLVFYILGVLTSMPGLFGAFSTSVQTRTFGILGLLVQLVALVMLFTGQRSLWFKRRSV